MPQTQTDFETHDLALSAALVAFGYSLSHVHKAPGETRAIFVFVRSSSLDDAIQQYWADDLLLSPRRYYDALRSVKTRLYSA